MKKKSQSKSSPLQLKSKRILLVLKVYRRDIHEAIYLYAKKQGWIIEYFYDLPSAWYGDGIIIDSSNEEEIRKLRKNDSIPVVSIQPLSGPRTGRVSSDPEKIAEYGLDYLQERALKNFLVIARKRWETDPAFHFYQLAKKRGFQATYHLWAPNEGPLIAYDFNEAIQSIKKIISKMPKPAAVFTGGLQAANLVYRACSELNTKIPDDLAILTNDDNPYICDIFVPGLTGISGGASHVGLNLAKMLDQMMEDPTCNPKPILITPEKIQTRQSTNILAIPHPTTAAAVDFIQKNYFKMIGVTQIASHAGTTQRELQKNFQFYMGKLPNIFLREIRMKHAKTLLEESEYTLEEISSKVGYSSSMTFLTSFKRIYGCTPGDYRNQYKPPKEYS